MPPMLYRTAWKGPVTSSLVVEAFRKGLGGSTPLANPSQPGVGDALQILKTQDGINREDIWLQTKFTPIDGQDPTKPLPYDPQAALTDQVHQSLATSLRELRTPYLDALILHSPMTTRAQHEQVWTAFEGAVRQGKNRWYADVSYGRDILQLCKKYNARFQSFWTLTGNPRLLTHPSLSHLASVYRSCSPEAALYELLIRRLGMTPLNGTTGEAHMDEAVNLLQKMERREEVTGDGAEQAEKAEKAVFELLYPG
ncbi:hypothetical protein JCM11641_003306 [Rhodosporidiobolus odoratus]